MIPVQDLGWMAGIIDLKGRLTIKNNKMRATRQIVLAVESTEIAVVRRLGRLTGSRAEARPHSPLKDWMRRGCNDHCPEAHVHVTDTRVMPAALRWNLTGAPAAVVMSTLLPFLTVDKGFEEVIPEILSVTSLSGQGAHAVLSSLLRLRELGWDMPEEFAEAVDGFGTRFKVAVEA